MELQRRLRGDRDYRRRTFADQFNAEYFVRTEGRGRTVDDCKTRPKKTDYQRLDWLVGTASMQGALLLGNYRPSAPKRERVGFNELRPCGKIVETLSSSCYGCALTRIDSARLVRS